MCRTQPAAVQDEVKKILGAERGTSAQGYFEQRTAGAKLVYENMDEVEKKKIDDEVERRRKAPNEPEIQQK